jgi:RNA polymerase sigma factor (sigma-70 family)
LTITAKYGEEELVMLVKQRNQDAFTYLYDNYAAALNGVIIKLVDDHTLAEDILQESFLKIWNNFGAYDASKGRLFTWMLNITRNLTIDTLRSKGYKKQAKISADENSVSIYADSSYGAASFDALGVKKHLAVLKPEQRVVIDLAYFSGFTQDEIAGQLGIPLGTVKTRMRSALIELRKVLQNR